MTAFESIAKQVNQHINKLQEENKLLREEKAALLEVISAMITWIDAVPDDTALPTMPGFDRDWADMIVYKAKEKTK